MTGRPVDEGVLATALDYAVTSAAGIGLADLRRPSACAGWTVADVLAHLTESLRCLATSLTSGVVPGVAARPAGPITARTLSRGLGRAAVSFAAAARDPRGRRSVAVDGLPLPCHRLIVVGALEAAVHGWDIARGPLPGDLATRLLAALPLVVDDTTRRGVFADPVALPPGRPAGERLLAALGREPIPFAAR
ncbi:maleylpyruvate isomerase family mycothiol-dependent enzyme [Amycolatopsis sp. NPDC021455]|uniref:maleylpyruvate isomerase family mycothiol-dependent enzyme n=1 Tax=Amycolatopsis sp. NPDC021455 TaxID=3154901 RepID=UPI0034097139